MAIEIFTGRWQRKGDTHTQRHLHADSKTTSRCSGGVGGQSWTSKPAGFSPCGSNLIICFTRRETERMIGIVKIWDAWRARDEMERTGKDDREKEKRNIIIQKDEREKWRGEKEKKWESPSTKLSGSWHRFMDVQSPGSYWRMKSLGAPHRVWPSPTGTAS